jgi:hypothetical protein
LFSWPVEKSFLDRKISGSKREKKNKVWEKMKGRKSDEEE